MKPEVALLPDDFKMTKLGPLPQHWQVVRQGEVARVLYGKAKPKTKGPIPVIGSGESTTGQTRL